MNISYSKLSGEVRIIMHQSHTAPVEYLIYDGDERLVRKGWLSLNTNVHNISTRGMPEGSYRIKIDQQVLAFEKRKLFA